MKKYIILIPIYNDTDSASQLIKNIDYEIANQNCDVSVFLVNDASKETIEFNNNPIEKIFISGANQKNIYPLRNFINTDILCKDYIDYLEHPTYKQYTHDIIDEKYYKKRNE